MTGVIETARKFRNLWKIDFSCDKYSNKEVKLVIEGRLHFVMIALSCLTANVNNLKKQIHRKYKLTRTALTFCFNLIAMNWVEASIRNKANFHYSKMCGFPEIVLKYNFRSLDWYKDHLDEVDSSSLSGHEKLSELFDIVKIVVLSHGNL